MPGTGRFITDVESGSERFVEIWNNVFMEFERDQAGVLTPLPAPSIDTGMGLERISAVMLGTMSNYDTPLFMPLLTALGAMCGRTYGATMDPADVSMRVVADHARAATFLIADGVVPSNEWRGYVLRKIMGRAMRHGHKQGLHEPFLFSLVDVLVREMGGAYPELKAGRDAVVQVIKSEEDRFDAVLTGGLPRLEEVLERAARGAKVVPGDEAFKLYDTYGLPRDFIEDLAGNQGLRSDAEGFEAAMEGQRVKARAGSSFDSKKAILNSGIGFPQWMSEFKSGIYRQHMEVNAYGIAHALEVLIPIMKEQGFGTIAGVTSMADVRGYSGSSSYVSSKSAASLLLESARVELKEQNIKVITIRPGFVKTAMTDKNEFYMPLLMSTQKAAKKIRKGIEKGRSVVQFPWPIEWATRIIKNIPNWIFDWGVRSSRPPKK